MIGTPTDNTKDEFETIGVTKEKRYITVSKTKIYETTGAHVTDSNRNFNITQKNINNINHF